MKLPVILLFFLLLAVGSGAGAAEADFSSEADYSQTWQIISYAQEASLAQQRVFDVAFTPDGKAWLAADDGLHCFDGYAWSLFKTNHGLPSSFVRAVCTDARGRLWVGSDAGAGSWDPIRQAYDAHGSETGLANANIREIDRDPDGTLWFSCDQWPETGVTPGGLSCRYSGSGHWETFRETNGLPMDYIIGYFRDSTGRQFALTPHGWSQRQGRQWGAPLNPGYEQEDRVLQMAEARDGTLFAQGEHTLLTLGADGRWKRHAESHTRVVAATRTGEVIAVESDPVRGLLWFDRWDGQQFVRASATVACPAGVRLYHLREAPDGSFWCVGTGTVVRWAFRAGRWTLYPQLPPPVGADDRGRVWFADETDIEVYANGHFQTLAPGWLRALSATGQAMIWDERRNELLATDPQDPTSLKVVQTGCSTVRTVVADETGAFWLLGEDQRGDGVVTRYDHSQSEIIASPEFHERSLSSATTFDRTQLLVVAHLQSNNRYGVACVTNGQVTWLPFNPTPPPLTYPGIIHAVNRCWLSGYSGLYEQSLTTPDRWRQVTDVAEDGMDGFLASTNELLITFAGGRSGHSGCALYASNRWQRVYGEFSNPAFGRDKKTIYLPSRSGVYIRRQPGTLTFEYLPIPSETFVNSVVADASGTLWLGTSDGTYRYRPSRKPPDTLVQTSVLELQPGTALPVSFRAQADSEKNNSPASFRYSWRINNGPWSAFEGWSEQALKLPELQAGRHRLEVRACDVDGNIDPTPAVVNFTILPEPLQNRPWFLPAVLFLAAVLAWLMWLRIAHGRQLAATNAVLRQEITVRQQAEAELERSRAQLEQRVTERTGQLTQVNARLRHEIAERQQAEALKLRLEEQLHQAQKLEAIGTLAGGIAHDFNNILAVIIPYCDMVIEELEGRPDLQEHLREVLKAANRAKSLVQQILTFSHRQRHQQRHLCQLEPAVKEALKLLRSALPSTIQMTQHLRSTHPVLADPTQIHQVIMNLCVNAQHAMEGRQGQLEVGLDEVLVDETLCRLHADLHPGLYVRITVRDTGCGIKPENLKRIFEPFFTTKEVGQGTGLGLAVVHGIVLNHEGAILVESVLGQGTQFQILLPAQIEALTESSSAVLPPPRCNGEHILIVDDELSIIKVLKRLLLRAGYQVTAQSDAQTALKDFLAQPAAFNLVLTDLTMPGLNGMELAAKIYETRPDLPVIIATGFGGDLITPAQLAEFPNIRKVVEKPLNPDDIIRLIAEILAADGKK